MSFAGRQPRSARCDPLVAATVEARLFKGRSFLWWKTAVEAFDGFSRSTVPVSLVALSSRLSFLRKSRFVRFGFLATVQGDTTVVFL